MDFFLKGMNEETSECPFDIKDIQRCPFLRNINKPTNFSFSSVNLSMPVSSLFSYRILLASILLVCNVYFNIN